MSPGGSGPVDYRSGGTTTLAQAVQDVRAAPAGGPADGPAGGPLQAVGVRVQRLDGLEAVHGVPPKDHWCIGYNCLTTKGTPVLRPTECEVDDIDLRLVSALVADARTSYAELARLVGLSAPSVHDRVRRLERDGVLVSWAVPKGPSMDPDDKRLAVAVPDHSLSYFKFEGELAEGTYGAGQVRIWDSGKYETYVDPQLQYDSGRISFTFLGNKVRGEFHLIRTGKDKNWLLIKADDKFASIDWELKTVLSSE